MGPSRLRFKRLVGIHHSTGLQGMDGTAVTRSDGFLIGAWGEGGTSLPLSVRACRQIRARSLRPTSYSYACRGRTYKRAYSRCGVGSPQTSFQAAIASKLAPTNPGSGGGARVLSVGAALAAMRSQPSSDFDTGCCRGQKTPPTESRPRLRSWIGRTAPVGAALAATRPLRSAGFDTGCCRGQKTPSTRPRYRLRSLIGCITLVGAALAAMRSQPSSDFDAGCCRGQKTPPTNSRPGLRPWALSRRPCPAPS